MIVEAVKNRPVNIGRLGENEARTVRFHVDDLQSEFPGCAFMVLHRRNQDETAYPVPSSNYTVEDGYLYWTVKSGDVAQKGSGECQISAILGSKIMKTDIYMTVVGRSLDDSNDPPDPWQSWTESIEERIDILEPDATSEDVGKFLKVKTVEEGKVTEYDLERLPELAIIDDTAGSGDTGKAWSADKLTSELDLKAPKANPAFTGSVSLSRKANTVAGQNSTATGYNVEASGDFANANGYETRAKNKSQNVFGEYNVPDTSDNPVSAKGNFVEIVGNGLREDSRSNARVLDWNGNERLMGNLYVGCNADGTGGTKAAKITEIPNANGPTSIQDHEGGVYDVGKLYGNLKVAVPFKHIRAGGGIGEANVSKRVDDATIYLHYLYNSGVSRFYADTNTQGRIIVETCTGVGVVTNPDSPPWNYQGTFVDLFRVASAAETQAIITEYAG